MKMLTKNSYEDNEILNKFFNERMGKVNELSKQIDFYNLTYRFLFNNLSPMSFISFNVHYISIKIYLMLIHL